MMAGVFISVDPVAALRGTNGNSRPDPVAAAAFAQVAGAAGIAASLGTEAAPIGERDLRLLRETVHTRLLIVIPATAELFGLAMDLRPDLCVLASMTPSPAPAKSGIDLIVHHKEIEDSVAALRNNGIGTLVFIDPQPEQIKLALQAGVDGVVLNSHGFSRSYGQGRSAERAETVYGHLVDGIKLAHRLKLSPWLAGGLGYDSLPPFKGIGEIKHLIVGHSVISQALFVGLQEAVQEMVAKADRL
jgi:pyridoxine 5-phosphate synthase